MKLQRVLYSYENNWFEGMKGIGDRVLLNHGGVGLKYCKILYTIYLLIKMNKVEVLIPICLTILTVWTDN